MVFFPNYDELDKLGAYIQKIEQDNPNIGICKIVSPQMWYQREYNLENIKLNVDPSQQVTSGISGAYNVTYLEEKKVSLQKFAADAMTTNEYTENLKDKESLFWRSLGKGVSPYYAADIEGSLFTGQEHNNTKAGKRGWTMDGALSDMLRLIPNIVPGVNTTMLYIGTWKTMFAFHVEDQDLYSINYLHTGAPKSWYSIQPSDRNRLESLAEGYFANELRACKEYLRHKTKLFSPKLLQSCGLSYDTVVQRPGEFVVTFPGAYHAGFNHNFNIAEATNFATPRWLQTVARKAKRCVCRPHSVFVDPDELEHLVRLEQQRLEGGSGANAVESSSSYCSPERINTNSESVSFKRNNKRSAKKRKRQEGSTYQKGPVAVSNKKQQRQVLTTIEGFIFYLSYSYVITISGPNSCSSGRSCNGLGRRAAGASEGTGGKSGVACAAGRRCPGNIHHNCARRQSRKTACEGRMWSCSHMNSYMGWLM